MHSKIRENFTFFAIRKASSVQVLLLTLLLSSFMASTGAAGKPGEKAKTYRNPLLEKWDMADPGVTRVKDTYYLYPTSHGKGYDALISKDLVNWEYKGRVFDDPRGGAWAPEVFHNERGDKKFYLYYTDTPPTGERTGLNKQIGVAISDDPLGPFTDKLVLAQESIDAHLFQDTDGSYYLYYVQLTGGFKIMVQPMSDPCTKRGEAREVIRPTEPWEKISGEVTEGPFILKHKDTYYLTYSGTGADSPNYGIGYATSKSPLGPFEKYKGNPIVKRSETIFGPGHHCVIEGPDKKLWMIYHQKRNDNMGYSRFLAIDPIWFDEQGILHAKVSRGTDEVAPVLEAQANLPVKRTTKK